MFDSGYSTDGDAVILQYNPTDDTWVVDYAAPRRAFLQDAVLADNGKTYLFGGADADTIWPYEKIAALSEGTFLTIFDFTGFFPPVENPPTTNVVKAGRSIPVKFSLNGDQGYDIFAEGFPWSQTIGCDSGAPMDEIEETVTAGENSLSYDPDFDQYIYVWKTNKAWAGTCRQLNVRLNDGTDHIANFTFK